MIKMTAQLGATKAFRHIEQVREAWADALKEEGKAIKAEYEKTTATWSTDVQFDIKPHVSGRVNWYVEVGTSNRIYWFVHESISVMRGVLSPDWSPKTQPRVLGSGPGSGRLLYASKSVNKPPYPAREFTEKIIEVRQPEFQKRMEHATAVGARKATQGG